MNGANRRATTAQTTKSTAEVALNYTSICQIVSMYLSPANQQFSTSIQQTFNCNLNGYYGSCKMEGKRDFCTICHFTNSISKNLYDRHGSNGRKICIVRSG